MSDGKRFPADLAFQVAAELRSAFEGRAERLVFAGSLRRRKVEVGDMEVVYIPKTAEVKDPADLFGGLQSIDATDTLLNELLERGVIAKRKNIDGLETWGVKNKFAVHCATGLPIDFFGTTAASYINYLVCRTGGAATNKAICNGAIARGMKWCPTCPGFVRVTGPNRTSAEWDLTPDRDRITVRTERDVFTHAGLEYREAWERA